MGGFIFSFFLVLVYIICKQWEYMFELKRKIRMMLSVGYACIGIMLILVLPMRLGEPIENEKEKTFETYVSSRYMYETLATPTYALQTMGEWEYLCKDIYMTLKNKEDVELSSEELEKEKQKVDSYFRKRNIESNNDMTGYFQEKNLILIQMESIDDWVISKKYTPTIHKLMSEGINFTNFYTPYFGTGYTINTEFAVNTGLFPYSNSQIAYGIPLKGNYPNTLGDIFRKRGYNVESFHMNNPDFYKRGDLHAILGYDSYRHAEKNNWEKAEFDSKFIEDKSIHSNLVKKTQFFHFIVSYSGHLPYDYDDKLTREILNSYPDLKDIMMNEEVNSLCIKAFETDQMFKKLIEKLKAEKQLENTVIVAYADHYAYGIKDSEVLQEVSGEDVRLEKTPFFIWSSDIEKMQVEKICSSVDVLPTIANLFNVGNKNDYLGRDIFDKEYTGIAYFKDYSFECGNMGEYKKIEEEISNRIILNQYMLDLYYYGELK